MTRGSAPVRRDSDPGSDGEAGLALIVVVGIAFVLTIMVLTLVQIGMSQYSLTARNTDGVKSQAAAEAGLNAYLGKLVQRNDFDRSYLHAAPLPGGGEQVAEATRVLKGQTYDCAALPSTSGSGIVAATMPANQQLAEFARTSAWEGALAWWHPCGFDAWAPVDPSAPTGTAALDGYQYALAVFPRDGNELRIVAAGRRDDDNGSLGTTRYVEVVVRPSSFSKYQMISQGDIVVNRQTTTGGIIYSTGTVHHKGTAANWVIGNAVCARVSAPLGFISCGSGYGTVWQGKGILSDCSPPEAFFVAGIPSSSCHVRERAGETPVFTNITKARQTIANKVKGGGGMWLKKSDLPGGGSNDWGYQIQLTSGGQIVAKQCTYKSGTVPPKELGSKTGINRGASSTGTAQNIFEDSIQCNPGTYKTATQTNPFFVYSEAPIAIAAGDNFVVSRGNVVSDEDIYIGGNVYYGPDTSESPTDLDNYVLGVHAYSEVILPAWVNSAIPHKIRLAAIAEEGSYHDSELVAFGAYSGKCESNWNNFPISNPPNTNVNPFPNNYICAKSQGLQFSGSWYSKKAANVTMYGNGTSGVQYDFYEQLASVPPPLWPNATNDFDVVRWRELKTGFADELLTINHP